MNQLQYTPLEKLQVSRPVTRIAYIKTACTNKNVLDLGCYDETALIKNNSGYYLFDEISLVSKNHIGIDIAAEMPEEGIVFSPTARMIKGDIFELDQLDFDKKDIEIIIAGELIEHLPDTLRFLKKMKMGFAGKRLICTTPNATSFFNIVFAFLKRESAHKDHLQVYSFKTLNTLCLQAGFENWQIRPYHVKFTEMILNSKGARRLFVKFVEKMVNLLESLFPMTGGGYLVDIKI